jgi:ethanolamine ammonia-lyase large subunit
MLDGAGTARPGVDRVASLYAKYVKAGGDQRTDISLEEEGRRRVATLRDRGFDLGLNDAAASEQRIERLYGHARSALYAHLDEHVITEATTAPARVRTLASSRDEYLARPSTGESLAPADARQLQTLYTSPRPQVQIVISDGLNANSVNEQLRTILPAVGRLLQDRGVQVGGHHIVVQHGRVRVGYEIGQHVVADVIVHLIGERPGTGLNTLSAYLTYGRDEGGRLRWTRDLDHSVTNAICGIHPRGKPPGSAAVEIARTVARMLEQRRSGVRLDPGPAGSRSGP